MFSNFVRAPKEGTGRKERIRALNSQHATEAPRLAVAGQKRLFVNLRHKIEPETYPFLHYSFSCRAIVSFGGNVHRTFPVDNIHINLG